MHTKLISRIKNISLVVIGAVITLAVVLALWLNYHSFSSFFTIKVVNNANSAITQIKIVHDEGIVYQKHLGIGKQVIIPVYAGGENSYKIFVKLKNGKVLKGGIGYVESGSSTKEVVTNSAIKSTDSF